MLEPLTLHAGFLVFQVQGGFRQPSSRHRPQDHQFVGILTLKLTQTFLERVLIRRVPDFHQLGALTLHEIYHLLRLRSVFVN